MGILFDEVVLPGDVFENHIHVPGVLATRGWRLLRFSSREWDLNRDKVLSEIRAAIN